MSAQASSTLSGTSLTYTWNFGDGTSQSGVNLTEVVHTYNTPSPSGTPYNVALTVTDGDQPASTSATLTIDDVPPTVNAGPSQTVYAGSTVAFNGSASDVGGSSQIASIQWDFNYDGSTFNPDASTLTVTVNPSNSLIVNAGPDQAINEGDTAAFNAAYTDGSGTVNVASAQWDFNYDGSNFVADPNANGTLTPSYQFTTPGTYLVAVQLTDSNNVTSIGTLYVSVAGVPPTVDAGPNQTVNQGQTVQFAATASIPSGVNTTLNYAWDFNYDGQNFVADPSNQNTLTPTYDFTTPGIYEVALQATDGFGQASLATTTVTVNDVPPTATVSNSGPGTVGSPITFTVSNLVDLTPGDTPTLFALVGAAGG